MRDKKRAGNITRPCPFPAAVIPATLMSFLPPYRHSRQPREPGYFSMGAPTMLPHSVQEPS